MAIAPASRKQTAAALRAAEPIHQVCAVVARTPTCGHGDDSATSQSAAMQSGASWRTTSSPFTRGSTATSSRPRTAGRSKSVVAEAGAAPLAQAGASPLSDWARLRGINGPLGGVRGEIRDSVPHLDRRDGGSSRASSKLSLAANFSFVSTRTRQRHSAYLDSYVMRGLAAQPPLFAHPFPLGSGGRRSPRGRSDCGRWPHGAILSLSGRDRYRRTAGIWTLREARPSVSRRESPATRGPERAALRAEEDGGPFG